MPGQRAEKVDIVARSIRDVPAVAPLSDVGEEIAAVHLVAKARKRRRSRLVHEICEYGLVLLFKL